MEEITRVECQWLRATAWIIFATRVTSSGNSQNVSTCRTSGRLATGQAHWVARAQPAGRPIYRLRAQSVAHHLNGVYNHIHGEYSDENKFLILESKY